MKRFLAALRFLTILPVPGSWGTAEAELAGSVAFFPVVGALIGLAAGAAALGLVKVLPALPVAVILAAGLAAVSQAFHLDGLSDTADGFLSSRPRERVLEIMKDSHVGAMGVVAVALALLLKVSALGSMPAKEMWQAALLMPICGRCAILVQMAILPYARKDGGLGAIFYRRNRMPEGTWAVVAMGLAGWLAAQWAGLAAAGATLVVTALFCLWSHRRIGGATGDTLGAGCEIAEVVPALVLCGWHYTAV